MHFSTTWGKQNKNKKKKHTTDSALKTVMKGLLELLGRTRGSRIGEERPPTGTGWTEQKSLGKTGDKRKGSRKRRGLGVPSGAPMKTICERKKNFLYEKVNGTRWDVEWNNRLSSSTRSSVVLPIEAIPYHRKVHEFQTGTSHTKKFQLKCAHPYFHWNYPNMKESRQVIKQANPLEMTIHKTLCGKWDVPSAALVSAIKKTFCL